MSHDPFPAYRFSRALLREPAASVVCGLRAVDRGDPSLELFHLEHAAYRAILENAGLETHVLPALSDWPDSVFIEDPAMVLPEGAILFRMAAPSRAGEPNTVREALETFVPVTPLENGHVDGGDILVTGPKIFAGLSKRTDKEGLDAMGAIVSGWGYELVGVDMPEGLLHLKTGCALLDEETILAVEPLKETFSDFRVLTMPEGEEAAANAVRVNDIVLLAAGYPRTEELLDRWGYNVRTTKVSQAQLLDGGLSCLSIRF
ncbi:dimethylarginine dimethylaminohydrolase family protein [Afifella sp. YEN Y35]|uniref:dimethylarginine dimethylaminohydrolase family protein n=1 Tax=Afifella sp. YEN Y35 TaxID=3388337 RepID=UPI0039E1C580